MIPYHSDPFDRLIIAQAIVEQVPVLSIDAAFEGQRIFFWNAALRKSHGLCCELKHIKA